MGKKEMEGIAWDGRIADDEFAEKHVIYVGLLILCLFMGFKLGTIRPLPGRPFQKFRVPQGVFRGPQGPYRVSGSGSKSFPIYRQRKHPKFCQYKQKLL